MLRIIHDRPGGPGLIGSWATGAPHMPIYGALASVCGYVPIIAMATHPHVIGNKSKFVGSLHLESGGLSRL